jgi:protocatechuate 3,4-dioxygenase beta subunit
MQPDGHADRHDRGLQYDLAMLWQRRRLLQLFSGVAVAALVGCSDDDTGGGTATAAARTPTASERTALPATLSPTVTVTPIPTSPTPLSACTTIPEETAGPYPGDGSNGPNALVQSGIVRGDIRASFGTSTTVATGVPFQIELTVVDTQDGCKPMTGAAVYLWHVDSQGRYSMYSQGATQENYLRGVQVADANGVVRFTSIFPAAYMGRWPHVHFEVYPSLDAATSSANKLATSQLALPEDICRTVYARADYPQSLSNLQQTPLNRDNVFADGVDQQMATVAGDSGAGYKASLVVGL